MQPEALPPLLTRIGFYLETQENMMHVVDVRTEEGEITVRLIFPDGTEIDDLCQDKMRMVAGESLKANYTSTVSGNPAVVFK